MDELTFSQIGAEVVLNLCDDNSIIDFNGTKYVPDDTKGYFRFSVSHSFPVETVYQTALHPAVIAASYQTMLNQNVNIEHQIREYHKKDNPNAQDHVIGSIVAVTFPLQPHGGWKIQADASKTPGIEGVGVFFKMTSGMNKIFGEHSTGRNKYTVSMEVQYPFNEQCGFALNLKPVAPGKGGGFQPPLFAFSPPDFLSAGYEYVPYDKAPADLIACFSKKKNRVVMAYKSRHVTVMMGGLNNPVHYAGLGIVKYGAESTAKLIRMAASAPKDASGPFAELAALIAESLGAKA